MRAALATFELVVGLSSGLCVMVMLASLAGISTPTWDAKFFLYWGAIFAGPLLLTTGAILTLVRKAERPASVMTLLGSAALTCWAIYLASSVPEERSRGAMGTGLMTLAVVLALVALASDFAAYRIYRLVSRAQ